MNDWFCKCCKNHYQRKDATFLKEGSMDELCYQITGMCTRCYKEANDGHEFGSMWNEEHTTDSDTQGN